jgi:hypothetical protein
MATKRIFDGIDTSWQGLAPGLTRPERETWRTHCSKVEEARAAADKILAAQPHRCYRSWSRYI